MKEILDFLAELSCNNNREWFNDHKDWYNRCHKHFEQFTAQWLDRLVKIDPELAKLQPKDCIWRQRPSPAPHKQPTSRIFPPRDLATLHKISLFALPCKKNALPLQKICSLIGNRTRI